MSLKAKKVKRQYEKEKNNLQSFVSSLHHVNYRKEVPLADELKMWIVSIGVQTMRM